MRGNSGDRAGAEACWRKIRGLRRPDRFSSVAVGIYGHPTRPQPGGAGRRAGRPGPRPPATPQAERCARRGPRRRRGRGRTWDRAIAAPGAGGDSRWPWSARSARLDPRLRRPVQRPPRRPAATCWNCSPIAASTAGRCRWARPRLPPGDASSARFARRAGRAGVPVRRGPVGGRVGRGLRPDAGRRPLHDAADGLQPDGPHLAHAGRGRFLPRPGRPGAGRGSGRRSCSPTAGIRPAWSWMRWRRGGRRGAAVAFHLHNFAYADRTAFADADAVLVPTELPPPALHRDLLGLDSEMIPYPFHPGPRWWRRTGTPAT